MPVRSFLNSSADIGDDGLVIVGAGAVGLTLAIGLARRGQHVTVLEAGPQVPPADYAQHNTGPVSGRPFTDLTRGRMRAYGGTTRLWGGQLVSFDRHDLGAHDEAGRPLWPISYDEFEPWTAQAFDLLGVTPAMRDTPAVYHRATGDSLSFSARLSMLLTIWLKQPDFTRLFATEIASNPLIDVVTDAEVQRLQFAPDDRVKALHIAGADGATATVHPRTVVLAAGTFETVRQLLRAKATEPACPFRDNANVGKWYIDHLNGIAGTITVNDRKAFARKFGSIFERGTKYYVKTRFSPDVPREGANIAALLLPPLGVREVLRDARSLTQRVFNGSQPLSKALAEAKAIASTILPFAWRYLTSRRGGLTGRTMQIGLEIEQLPDPDSYLYLDPEAPPETAPVGVHWAVGGKEAPAVREFCAALQTAFAESGIGKVDIVPAARDGDPGFLEVCHNSGHYMGGARMADDASHGVVDRDCRVFGCENLYLAGAMVFPSGSFANSTLTAIALGQRLASHLAQPPKDAAR